MAKVPMIVPVSDLRQDAAAVLKKVRDSNQPVFITQRGRATAVLMSIDAFERSENQRELLILLARGEKEIASEIGHSLDSVLADDRIDPSPKSPSGPAIPTASREGAQAAGKIPEVRRARDRFPRLSLPRRVCPALSILRPGRGEDGVGRRRLA
jgi:prevent-host-death family protein